MAAGLGLALCGSSGGADDEVLAGGLDDFHGDDGLLVDLHDAFDLSLGPPTP